MYHSIAQQNKEREKERERESWAQYIHCPIYKPDLSVSCRWIASDDGGLQGTPVNHAAVVWLNPPLSLFLSEFL